MLIYTCAFARYGDDLLGLGTLVLEKSITANQLTCTSRGGSGIWDVKGSLTFNYMELYSLNCL